MEAVTGAPAAAEAGGRSHEQRCASIRLVAMREILERGRSRGYVLSLVFTIVLLAAGFILPSLLIGDDATKIARRGAGAAGPRGRRSGRRRTRTTWTSWSRRVPDRADGRGGRSATSRSRPRWSSRRTCRRPGELIVHEDASSSRSRRSPPAPSSRSAPPRPAAARPADGRRPRAADRRRTTTALIFANAGIILMFIGIFSYGTWVLTGVVEEKQSRVVEVVLSTVRPRDLLIGKVLGIGAARPRPAGRPRGGRDHRGPDQRPARAAADDPRRGGPAADLVHPRVRAVLDDDGLPRVARVADGGGVERVDAGHDGRDGVLPGLDPARHRRTRTASSPGS